ncbi:hypothetical protein GQX74_013136 [Glossina fuscipes]|nr:hypothetical protein GQX74_013136 [Glossina fuscipes]
MHFLILQALKVVCLRRRPVNVLSLTVILEPRRAESVMGVLCGRILPVLGFREKITADGLSVSMSTLETKFEDMCSELMNLIKQCHNLTNDAEPGPEFKLNAFNTFYFRCIDVLKIMGTLNKAKSCSVGIHGTPINFRVCSETAHVVPIRKSRVVNNPDDLRTISLFPAIPKIAEHLINNHVFEATRTNTYESQYASDIVLPHCHSALRILDRSQLMNLKGVNLASYLCLRSAGIDFGTSIGHFRSVNDLHLWIDYEKRTLRKTLLYTWAKKPLHHKVQQTN